MCRCVAHVHRVCGIMCLCMYRGVVLCRNVHVHVCRNVCRWCTSIGMCSCGVHACSGVVHVWRMYVYGYTMYMCTCRVWYGHVCCFTCV